MNPERRKLITANRKNVKKGRLNSEEIFQDKRMQRSNTIKEFPYDMVVEILSRLPVKSLCRFKCVCRFWCNLMSDSLFVKLQLNQSIKANRLTYAFYDSFDFPRRLELDYESLVNGNEAKPTADDSLFGPNIRVRVKNVELTRKMEVWGSCNGLLCVFAAPRIIVLANPSTRETKTIFCRYGPKRRRSIINDDTIRGGFGYDAFHDDYKVLTINSQIGTVDVYSLKNSSWSYTRNLPREIITIRERSKPQHLNGAIHWIAWNRTVNGSKPELGCITAFDLTKEEFFSIPTKIAFNDINRYDLYTNQGRLCMVSNPFLQSICEVWIMEIYGVKESWKRINLTFSYRHSLTPLNLPKSEEALFIIDGRLFLYNHKNGNQKEIAIGQIPMDYVGFMLDNAFSYVESLVSLDCSSRKKQKA